MLTPHVLLVFAHGEDRIDWYATHRDLVGRYPQHFQIDAGFVDRHEVLLIMMTEPHGMHVKVGYDDRLTTRETLFCLEPRDNLSRQKMRADNHVRLIFAQDLYEGPRVELVEGE